MADDQKPKRSREPRTPPARPNTTPFDEFSQVPPPWGPAIVAPQADRGADGKFVAGNGAAKGGKGNTYASQLNQIRHSLYASVNHADMRMVLGALVKAAKGGSIKHIEVLLALVGMKPSHKIDVTATTITPKEAIARVALYFGFDDPTQLQPPALPAQETPEIPPAFDAAAPGPKIEQPESPEIPSLQSMAFEAIADSAKIEHPTPAPAPIDEPPSDAPAPPSDAP